MEYKLRQNNNYEKKTDRIIDDLKPCKRHFLIYP